MIWPRKQKSHPTPPPAPPAAEAPAHGASPSYLLQAEEFVWQDRRFRAKLLHLLRASLRGVEGLIAPGTGEREAAGPGRSWNIVGHLRTPDGEEYGYQLTLSGVSTGGLKLLGALPLRFLGNPLFFARFAVTDLGAGRFYFAEKTNLLQSRRPCGSSDDAHKVWIDDWQLEAAGCGYRLRAGIEAGGHRFRLEVELGEGKPTDSDVHSRMPTRGKLIRDDRSLLVEGVSWFELERSDNLTPWAEGIWMGLQLEDGTEWRVTLPRVHVGRVGADGQLVGIPAEGGAAVKVAEVSVQPHGGAATAAVVEIGRDGRARALAPEEYKLAVMRTWQSTETQVQYPVVWELEDPARQLSLVVEPFLVAQELECLEGSLFQYWQGLVRVTARRAGNVLHGHGFMRLTGYERDSIQEAKALRLFDFLENIRALRQAAGERAGQPGQEYVRYIDSKLLLYSALLGVILRRTPEELFDLGIMKLFVEFRTHVIRVSDDLIEKIVKPAYVPAKLHRLVELLELGEEKYRRAWEKVRRGERLTAADYERMIPMFTTGELEDAGVSRQQLEALDIEGVEITGNKADVHSGYFAGLPAAIAATGLTPEQTERIFLGWAQGCLAGFRSIVNEERAHDLNYLVAGPPLVIPLHEELEPDTADALGIVYDQSGRIFEGVVAALLDVYSPHDASTKAAYTRFFKYLCVIMQFLDDRNDVGDDWQKATNIVISLAHTHYPEEYQRLCRFLETENSPGSVFLGRKGQRRLAGLMPRTMALWQSFMAYFLRLLEGNEPFSYEVFYYLIAKRYTDANDARFNVKLRNLRKVASNIKQLISEGRRDVMQGSTDTTLMELALLSLVFEEPFLKHRLIDLYWEWRVTATFMGDRFLEEHASELGLDLLEKRWRRRAPDQFFFPSADEARQYRLPESLAAQVEKLNERIATLERTVQQLPGLDDGQRRIIRAALVGAWDACLEAFFLEERYRVAARKGYENLRSRRRAPVEWVLQIWDAKNGGMFRQLLKMRDAFPKESSGTDHSRFVGQMGNFFQALDDLLDARDDYLSYQPNVLVALMLDTGELDRLLERNGSGPWSLPLLEQCAPRALARWRLLCTELKESIEDEAPLLISPLLAFLENRALNAGISPVSLADTQDSPQP